MALLGLILQILIVAYLVLGEPIYGKRVYGQLVGAVATDPQARSRFYWRIIRMEWGLSALALLALWLRGKTWAAIGLRTGLGADPFVQGAVSGVMGGLVVGLVGSIVAAFFSARFRALMSKQLTSIGAMMPITAAERWQFAAVSVTAGICEETLFRGLMALTLLELFPASPLPVTVLVLALVFGFAHWYQGWRGVLGTGALGAGFALLYLATSSLWPGMLLHALVDLRVIGLVLAMERGTARGAAV